MARKKTEKTTVCFENPELLKKMIGDIEDVENKSFSSIIERIIFTNLLPKNSDAKCIVEHYLYGENGGIGQALSAVFSSNSAGVNWEAAHDNLLPIVQFASRQEVFCNISLTGTENELYHAYSQMQSIIDRLNKLSEEAAVDEEKRLYYEKEAKRASELLRKLQDEPERSRLVNFYYILLDNWEDFRDWSITYRLLYDLVMLEKGWRDNPEVRIELLQLIRSVSSEW